MVKPILTPPIGQALGPGLANVIEQLERHCLAPDASLIAKPTYYDLLLAREEMGKERLRYLEAMALCSEAVAMVEEYQQAISVSSSGGIRDIQALFSQLGLASPPEVYEALEQRLVIGEAAQRLRLPVLPKDGEIHEEELEKWNAVSRSSIDSTSTSISVSVSSSINTNTSNSASIINNNASSLGTGDTVDMSVGGVLNRFLGITPSRLRRFHLSRAPFAEDSSSYLLSLIPELEVRLMRKCEKLVSAFTLDETGTTLCKNQRLPERVKSAVEEIEQEEALLLEDLYSSDRKFSEYYNVLEQILGVVIKLVKDFKLQHQHEYDGLRKSWLCKRCQTMNAKLRVLEHLLLRDTYTQESIPALHKIRSYLVEAEEEASTAYNRAVTRLREYQGVDKYFDDIARRYHDLVQKLEGIQWTIRQVEMDLNNVDNNSTL